jgi:dUTP pyrophosphatase
MLQLKKIHEAAVIPKYKSKGASGADLHCVEDSILTPGIAMAVATGLQVAFISDGYELQIRARSSMALNGIIVANGPGTIDNDYRGEIKVILLNLTTQDYKINKGERIAQVIVKVCNQSIIEEAFSVKETERGQGGFGSTGR